MDSELLADDPEIKKKVKVNSTAILVESSILDSLELLSSWYRQKRVLCKFIKFIRKCQRKQVAIEISMADMESSEAIILLLIKDKCLSMEMERLKNNKSPKSSAISQLNPFFDKEGLMSVGGRLSNASTLDEKIKHPVILPKKGCTQIIQWYHNRE